MDYVHGVRVPASLMTNELENRIDLSMTDEETPKSDKWNVLHNEYLSNTTRKLNVSTRKGKTRKQKY